MSALKELKHSLRDISLWDRFCSLIQKSPATFSESYNEIYDKSLSDFIDAGVEVVDINRYEMKLKSKQTGKSVILWVSNYPYSCAYGYSSSCGRMSPSWKTIFKVREIQLMHKEKVVAHEINEWGKL